MLFELALLGSMMASDFANDYSHGTAQAHERQIERRLDRIERQIDRLRTTLGGAQAERDFWSNGSASGLGGGGKVDGIGEGRR